MRLLAQHALTDKKHNIHPQLLVTKSTIYRSLYHCLHTHTQHIIHRHKSIKSYTIYKITSAQKIVNITH